MESKQVYHRYISLMPTAFTRTPSPLGELTLVASVTGLTAVYFPTSRHVPPLHVVERGTGGEDDVPVAEREAGGKAEVVKKEPGGKAHVVERETGGEAKVVEREAGGEVSEAQVLIQRAGTGWVKDDGSGPAAAVLARAREQLNEYFARTRTTFDLPLDPAGSAFERRVWDALRAIPYGSTVSYGELARRLGDPRATRAVGAANGKNPIPIIVPCHRVVGARGELTGFGGGLDRKRWLLEHEGAALALGY